MLWKRRRFRRTLWLHIGRPNDAASTIGSDREALNPLVQFVFGYFAAAVAPGKHDALRDGAIRAESFGMWSSPGLGCSFRHGAQAPDTREKASAVSRISPGQDAPCVENGPDGVGAPIGTCREGLTRVHRDHRGARRAAIETGLEYLLFCAIHEGSLASALCRAKALNASMAFL